MSRLLLAFKDDFLKKTKRLRNLIELFVGLAYMFVAYMYVYVYYFNGFLYQN